MVILMLLMTAWPAFAEETDGEGQTEEVVITSGKFGPTSTWNYDEETETLYIEGTGASFEDTGYPWNWQDIWPRKAVIGEGITSIGDSAFEKCKVLTGARIPAGVQYIGYSAFENCSDLKTLKLPEGTGKSGEGIVLEKRIFENCSSLKSVTIPANIRDIPRTCSVAARGCPVSPVKSLWIPSDHMLSKAVPFARSCLLPASISSSIPERITNVKNSIMSRFRQV